ncbi:outer membrane lipoprotein-sorting protein [bacterium AH-315-F18]|nr:outer membrane lipoprotein-sorting protein [bacterium AH-315-F18]
MFHPTNALNLVAISTLATVAFLAEGLLADDVTAQHRGLAIARAVDTQDLGFRDYKVNVTMVLKNRHGQESRRVMKSRTLEQKNEGDKTIIIFNRPRDVKGTAFLSHTHRTGNDDQWLFLPALKRVKRIASNNKSGPFMGSEFSYEDIASQEVEKYRYRFLGQEKLDGQPVDVVERVPVDKRSGYTRHVAYYHRDHHRVEKVVFYDRKNAQLKTLVYRGYKQYLGRYWRPDEMYMENHQTGKTTRLIWTRYAFRNGYTDRSFHKSALKRAR